MTHQISQLTIEKYLPDILINVSRESYETYEFYKAADIIKDGVLAVNRVLG